MASGATKIDSKRSLNISSQTYNAVGHYKVESKAGTGLGHRAVSHRRRAHVKQSCRYHYANTQWSIRIGY